jgi:hypothetical protein
MSLRETNGKYKRLGFGSTSNLGAPREEVSPEPWDMSLQDLLKRSGKASIQGLEEGSMLKAEDAWCPECG